MKIDRSHAYHPDVDTVPIAPVAIPTDATPISDAESAANLANKTNSPRARSTNSVAKYFRRKSTRVDPGTRRNQ